MPAVKAGNSALDRLSNLIKIIREELESGLGSLSLSFLITGIFLSLGFLNTIKKIKRKRKKKGSIIIFLECTFHERRGALGKGQCAQCLANIKYIFSNAQKHFF